MQSPDTEQAMDDEIRRFDALGGDWWNETGGFAGLHRLTPPRIAYIRAQTARLIAGRDHHINTPIPFKGLKVVDIGCGGGILAEPLARLGAEVTGIDLSPAAIKAAQAHAAASSLSITYREISAGDLADEGERFDLVIASEVIEHVSNRVTFLKTMARLGHSQPKNRGSTITPSVVIITTINKGLASVLLAKFAAEYVFHLAPKGAHDPKKFVSPATLRGEARAAGIALDDISGIRPDPRHGFRLGGAPIINYAAAGLVTSI